MTQGTGPNGSPLVEINNAGVAEGLTVTTTKVSIQGLAIDRCTNVGIDLTQGSGNDTISFCFIGTDTSGSASGIGNPTGIFVASSGNWIGGLSLGGPSNLISGNGIGINVVGLEATQNIISGNYVGTDFTGALPLSNGSRGIILGSGATKNTVAGNLISWNVSDGVRITDSGTTQNLLSHNMIGTSNLQNNACPNGAMGWRSCLARAATPWTTTSFPATRTTGCSWTATPRGSTR